MNEKHLCFDPFRMVGPKLNAPGCSLDGVHSQPVPETISFQEGLMVMSGKMIEMIRLLSKCVVSGAQKQMGACESLASEVRQQEGGLTAVLLSRDLRANLPDDLIRLPHHLERIGDMLERILIRCRDKARTAVPFSDKAYGELDQIFVFLLDMMMNLHDAIGRPNKVLLEHIISSGKKLGKMLLDFRSAHWKRLEAGFCTPHASAVYLDILDSMTTMNEYLTSVCATFLELGTTSPTGATAPEHAQEKRLGSVDVR
jgi:phosphate:Na+ symporter